jgi:hypothetical protein
VALCSRPSQEHGTGTETAASACHPLVTILRGVFIALKASYIGASDVVRKLSSKSPEWEARFRESPRWVSGGHASGMPAKPAKWFPALSGRAVFLPHGELQRLLVVCTEQNARYPWWRRRSSSVACVGWAERFAALGRPLETNPAEYPPTITVCQLFQNPLSYSRGVIAMRGTWKLGADSVSISDNRCARPCTRHPYFQVRL